MHMSGAIFRERWHHKIFKIQELGAANHNTLLATIQEDVAENKGGEQ